MPTEQRRMETALRDLVAEGRVELTWLPGQTWPILRDALLRGSWHMLHFVGHGGYDAEADEGLLAFATEGGEKHLLTATQVGRLLADHDTLRLVVLNACEGARGSERDLLSSTAVRLVRSGVPAVVAMQYAISDDAAIQFGARFYAGVAHDMPVDAAVAEARIGMSVAARESAEWGTPVLYMQSPDGRVFDLAATSPTRQPAPPPPVDPDEEAQFEGLWTRAQAAYYTERWAQAIALYGEILAVQPDYRDTVAKRDEARRQIRLAELYASGVGALETESWAEAVDQLQAAVALDPGYRDAAALLEEAGRRRRLANLYAEARELHDAGAQQAALNVLERLRALDAEYPDAERLETAVREALAAEAREREGQALLRRALDHMDAQEWSLAIEALEVRHRQVPATEETAALLERARQAPARQQQASRQAEAEQRAEAERRAETERLQQLDALAAADERAHETGDRDEAVRPISAVDPQPSPDGSPGRRRRLPWVALAALAIAALVWLVNPLVNPTMRLPILAGPEPTAVPAPTPPPTAAVISTPAAEPTRRFRSIPQEFAVAQWGSRGSGPGQFSSPTGVGVDGQGNVYVVDMNNHRIQKLGPNGEPVAQWGNLGPGSGQYRSPSDVTVDGRRAFLQTEWQTVGAPRDCT